MIKERKKKMSPTFDFSQRLFDYKKYGFGPKSEAPYLSIILTATTQQFGGQLFYRKFEAWNAEIIGANITESVWGTLTYYNFNARMVCTIFENENFETDF